MIIVEFRTGREGRKRFLSLMASSRGRQKKKLMQEAKVMHKRSRLTGWMIVGFEIYLTNEANARKLIIMGHRRGKSIQVFLLLRVTIRNKNNMVLSLRGIIIQTK